jgi:hypothetical protein
VLDELLCHSSKKPFKTLAQLPVQSPNEFRPESKEQTLNLTSFLLDLRTQIAVSIQRHGKLGALSPLETLQLPKDTVHTYEIVFDCLVFPDASMEQENVGQFVIGCLGLVLERRKPGTEEPDDTSPIEAMMAHMRQMMGGPSKTPTPIRDDILSKGSKDFCVLSCVEWEVIQVGEDNVARFFMSEADFQTHQNHFVSVLRTDGWFRLGKPVLLSMAKRLGERRTPTDDSAAGGQT